MYRRCISIIDRSTMRGDKGQFFYSQKAMVSAYRFEIANLTLILKLLTMLVGTGVFLLDSFITYIMNKYRKFKGKLFWDR
jgi:hypothetical protein